MIETFNNRIQHSKFLEYFMNIGLVIVDEAHLSHFKKIFQYFPYSLRLGFTATPISADKKDPLKNHWEDIVVISNVKTLIELNTIKPSRGVIPCDEYSLKNIDRSLFKIKGKDFDEKQMSTEFSRDRQIENTINAYFNFAVGKKTLCFNVDIEHSLKMHNACIAHDINSRHIDSDTKSKYSKKQYRKDTFEWVEKTPNAFLNNVGIATIGTDILLLK